VSYFCLQDAADARAHIVALEAQLKEQELAIQEKQRQTEEDRALIQRTAQVVPWIESAVSSSLCINVRNGACSIRTRPWQLLSFQYGLDTFDKYSEFF
jgi:hypothetical protein